MDRDEPRFAESSREMIETGNYTVPHFNGQVRFDKPPFFYWCQALSYKIFGENDFAARFPSAFMAALTSLLVFGFGRRLGGMNAAFWGAVMFSLSAHTLILAKAAVTDATLVFFYTASVWAAWELLEEGKKFWRAVFYLSLALGFLTKGPVALLPLGAAVFFARRKNIPLKRLWLSGIFLSVFIIGLWALPAYQATNGEYWRVGLGRHVGERALSPMEGHGASGAGYFLSLPFYFILLPLSFFPWSLHLGKLFRWSRLQPSLAAAYLWCQIGTVFLVFTLLQTKLPHYTFPALPLLALLLAFLWERQAETPKRLIRASCVMTALVLLFSFAVLPFAASYFPVRALSEKCAEHLKPGMALASHAYNEPSLTWYFRKYARTPHRLLAEEETASFMAETGARILVLPAAAAEKLFPNPDPSWKKISAGGYNPAKGGKTELTALIKTQEN